MYMLVIFLIQKLIYNKIECEFLQIGKSCPNQLFIKESNNHTFKIKINRLSCNQDQFFSEVLNRLFHQLQPHHYKYTVLFDK